MFNPTLDRRAALRRLSVVLGGVATAPLASGLLSGCRTPSGADLASYEFQSLTGTQPDLLAALVDQIIPETDTPGAAEVGVPQFVDMMLTDWYAADERDGFLTALDAVDRRAGGSFVDLEDAARAELVATMDAEAFADTPGAVGGTADADADAPDEDVVEAAQEGTSAARDEAENEVAGMQGDLGEAQADDSMGQREVDEQGNEVDAPSVADAGDGPPFFRQLKELTIAGYYTSEAGATQELQWLASPGRYDADVPLSEVGRAWA